MLLSVLFALIAIICIGMSVILHWSSRTKTVLTDEQKATIEEKSTRCPYCGGFHIFTICPYVAEVVYDPSGKVMSIKFRVWRLWLTRQITYLD